MPPSQPKQQGMDPQAIALAQAIRQTESQGNFNAKGASGEFGAYQWMPNTWKLQANQFLGDPNAPMTPSNQNAVAYSRIKELKDQGYNPAQIAAIWNSGSPDNWENKIGTNASGVAYNVPAYVKRVTDNYQQFRPQGGQSSLGVPVANASTGQDSQDQGYSVGGFIGNIASSAGNVLGGLGQAILHPIQTVQNLGSIIGGAAEKPFGVQNQDTQAFDNIVSYFGKRYGGSNLGDIAHNIVNTAYKDPVGVALDLSTFLDGISGAIGGVGKLGEIGDLAKVGEVAGKAADLTNPLTLATGAASKIAGGAGTLTRSVTSHLLSLSDPGTISEILSKPEEFSKAAMEATSRGSVAEDFGSSLEQLQKSVQETGSQYGGIAAQETPIAMPENWIQDVLSKGTSVPEEGSKAIPFKLNVVAGNPDKFPSGLQVVADTKSFTRDPGDLAAIQQFVNTWGDKSTLTPQEFLNMRQDLAKMSKFGKDLGRNDGAELVSRALRSDANKTMRPQVPGLKQLDEQSAPMIQQLTQAKKDFLTKGVDGSWEFKANALNKIANATGKGKDALLARMEEISPGITRRIQVLKAVEDVESAYKLKVGSYTRGITSGLAITGNVPAIAAAIITNPTIAIPLLRGLGWSAAKVAPLVKVLRAIIGNPTSLRNIAEMGQAEQVSSSAKISPTDQPGDPGNPQPPQLLTGR